MRLNKIMKIVVAVLLMALVAVMFSQTIFASGEIDPMTSRFDETFSQKDNTGASQAASNIIGTIINVAQVIGMGVAIIMLIVLAIKYIAASPDGKAEIKKNATIYIVGAVILFAASGILGIIRNFAKNVADQ